MADPVMVSIKLEGNNTDIALFVEQVESFDFGEDVIEKDITHFGTSASIDLTCLYGDWEQYFLKLSKKFPEVIVLHQEFSEYGETSVTFKSGKESNRKEELYED